MMQKIDLDSPLTLKNSFLFPLQSSISKKEIVIGGLYLLVPVYGWILNMGHRIVMTHQMQHGESAWPAWKHPKQLFKHGLLTFLGMVQYHTPAVVCEFIGKYYHFPSLNIIGIILWIMATIIVPGYMSHYCLHYDAREIFDPRKAVKRVFQLGTPYFHAWFIALCALILSFTGLIFGGIGFLFTSVWFWQVAGFSFATAFSQKYKLKAK
jgi:hypothetical protein